MLLVLRIGHGVEEQLEAGYAADIFGRLLAWAVDVAGIVSGGIGGGGRLDRRFHERNFGSMFGQQKALESGCFQGLVDWLRGGATTDTDIR